jgi:cell division septation protein DedD
MTTTGTGTIEPGNMDIGIHCDDCTTIIGLPFAVRLYGQLSVGAASVSSNGNLQFLNRELYAGTSCPLPDPNLATAILPYQDDLRTDQVADCSVFASGCGVFTSVTGTAPNRAFNIEWRAAYSGRSGTANFEVRFYENQNFFDVIYGATVDNGGSEESGVQAGSSLGCSATTFSCHTPTLTNGLRVTYTCGAPFTPTPTATPTATHTPTATPTATSTPTPSSTPRPSPTPRIAPTPRSRPTPPPRP